MSFEYFAVNVGVPLATFHKWWTAYHAAGDAGFEALLPKGERFKPPGPRVMSALAALLA